MYSTKYILAFDNELNENYEIYFDYLGYIGLPSNIIGAVDSLTLRCTGGDDNRFYPLAGTECLINIFVGTTSTTDDSQLTIYDLIAQQDNQIRVTVYKDHVYDRSIYQGFVVVENNSQPFLDPPFTLSVRALDGLGLLKGVDLLDANGNPFVGALNPIVWVANILYKTGSVLNIRGFFNIVNTSSLGFQPLQAFTIPAITFQKSQPQSNPDPTIDVALLEADDCYTALEKIVRCLRCVLFQQEGVWNLVNLWDRQNPNGATCFEYAISAPDLVSGLCSATAAIFAANQDYSIPVGSDQLIHPMKDDGNVYLKLATKYEKLNYTYDQSLNKVCNQNLQQGLPDPSHDGTIPSNVVDPSSSGPVVIFNYKAYFAFCMTHMDLPSGPGSSVFPQLTPTAPAYIRQVNDILGYSVDRYLTMYAPVGNIGTAINLSTFQIDAGDILQMSFNWRTRDDNNNSPSVLYDLAFVLLYGDDGTFWSLRCVADGSIPGNPTQWRQASDNTFNVAGATITGPGSFHTDVWTQVSVNQTVSISNIAAIKAPVSGNIQIILTFFNNVQHGTEYWFKDINISILPYLQGSYQQLKGDFNYGASNQPIKQTDIQDVEISDSPKRYFKGAILQADGLSLMPPTWLRNGIGGATYRFTQLMDYMLYNAIYRQMQKIEGTFRGLTWVDRAYTVRQAGMLNIYYFPNHPVPTKKFMLTSFEIDITTGMGRRVFVEILNDANDNGQTVPDNYIFQYLFQ